MTLKGVKTMAAESWNIALVMVIVAIAYAVTMILSAIVNMFYDLDDDEHEWAGIDAEIANAAPPRRRMVAEVEAESAEAIARKVA